MVSLKEDPADDASLRHGYDRHVGDDCGSRTMAGTYRFGQYCPMFFTQEGATAHLEGMYRGRACFLIGGGPSLATHDLEQLRKAGCLTFGLNNSAKVFRPDLWTCVDDPGRFLYSVWQDPRIMKLVPMAHFKKNLWTSCFVGGQPQWRRAGTTVGDMPNVWGFRRNEKFAAHRFLTENTINWGCHKDFGGCRSVMIAAMRLMWELGIRTVYLLGVDMKMTQERGYAFDEGRSPNAVRNNEHTYARMLSEYFPKLKPEFDAHGYKVYNCNPDSCRGIFPHKPFAECVAEANAAIGDTARERTEGMYLVLEEKERLGTAEAALEATKGLKPAKES
jgi:hypothetical protein